MRWLAGWLLTLWICTVACQAHEVVVQDENGNVLVVLKLELEWTALAVRNGMELTSANGHTRIHCVQLSAYSTLEEAIVYLQTVRDTLFQSFQETSNQRLNFAGKPARKVTGRGDSRGFDTTLEVLLFRDPRGQLCMVMLQQDVGHEIPLPEIQQLIRVP